MEVELREAEAGKDPIPNVFRKKRQAALPAEAKVQKAAKAAFVRKASPWDGLLFLINASSTNPTENSMNPAVQQLRGHFWPEDLAMEIASGLSFGIESGSRCGKSD